MSIKRLLILIFGIFISGCGTESTPVYEVNITTEPSEAGSVSPSTGQFDEGTRVQIKATPNEHWVFNGWSGGHSGSTNPDSITVNGDISITALFEKMEYPLTTQANGEGTINQEVITAKTDYKYETVVRLTAIPDDFWNFIKWEGDISGNENPVDITIDGATNVTAVFEINKYTLSLDTQGEGELQTDPDLEQYDHGEEVEINAAPDEGWMFKEWIGDHSGDENPLLLTMESDKEITAVFDEQEYQVTVTSDGKGSVSYSPGKDSYNYGEEIELEARAGSDNEFIRWEGALSSNKNPITLTVTNNHEIIAVFRTVEQALIQRYSSAVIIGSRVHQAGLTLKNNLPETVTVTRFTLYDQNGSQVVQSTDNLDIPSGSSNGYSISFGNPPTEDTFAEYSTKWRVKYKGNNYTKSAKVGTFGSTAKIDDESLSELEVK